MSAFACPCICGADLARGISNGTWTLGGVACPYRTCEQCKSTRAFMPAIEVAGRLVALYAFTETSEVSGEWTSLLDALEHAPITDNAQLIRNGVTLATTVVDVQGRRWWKISEPLHEVPAAV